MSVWKQRVSQKLFVEEVNSIIFTLSFAFISCTYNVLAGATPWPRWCGATSSGIEMVVCPDGCVIRISAPESSCQCYLVCLVCRLIW